MVHLRIFTRRILRLAALLLATSVAACTDTTSPDQADATALSGYLTTSAAVLRTRDGEGINFNEMYPTLAYQLAKRQVGDGFLEQSFTVDPTKGALVEFGALTGNVIAIPANTICDPATTGYGPTEWLKSCSRATRPIEFKVTTWIDLKGRPQARFEPDVRFSPSAARPVRLFFKDHLLRNYSTIYIPYCTAIGTCVKEEATDSFLTTKVTPITSGGYWVYRNLRHFSGYNVTAF